MPEPVRVRMYNVGFGDCFLLEFPRHNQEPFRFLVDCGAHTAGYPTPGWRPDKAVANILRDVASEDGRTHLDVVVATHRHQDHVSGFAAEAWRKVTVREVWMPWTEDPTDTTATRIRERQSRLALGLNLAFAHHTFDARWTNTHMKDSMRAMVGNSLTNVSAMGTLHRGFAGQPKRRFLSSALARPVTFDDCPGLAVHVLGPSRDEAVIRDMDPPIGQSYLRYHQAARPDPESSTPTSQYRPLTPIPPNLTMPCHAYEAEETYPTLGATIKAAATAMTRDEDLVAAVSLEKSVNGTSLMLMFEFGDAYLLFPGDAQWGTWNAALRSPRSCELLARTTFYKVGHHGSHNATPVEFLDNVLPASAKMWGSAVSVHPVPFWPEIPRAALIGQLAQHSDRVVCSHAPGPDGDGYTVRPGAAGVDFQVPC